MRKLKSYSDFIQVKENASFDLLKFDAFANELNVNGLEMKDSEDQKVVNSSESDS